MRIGLLSIGTSSGGALKRAGDTAREEVLLRGAADPQAGDRIELSQASAKSLTLDAAAKALRAPVSDGATPAESAARVTTATAAEATGAIAELRQRQYSLTEEASNLGAYTARGVSLKAESDAIDTEVARIGSSAKAADGTALLTSSRTVTSGSTYDTQNQVVVLGDRSALLTAANLSLSTAAGAYTARDTLRTTTALVSLTADDAGSAAAKIDALVEPAPKPALEGDTAAPNSSVDLGEIVKNAVQTLTASLDPSLAAQQQSVKLLESVGEAVSPAQAGAVGQRVDTKA